MRDSLNGPLSPRDWAVPLFLLVIVGALTVLALDLGTGWTYRGSNHLWGRWLHFAVVVMAALTMVGAYLLLRHYQRTRSVLFDSQKKYRALFETMVQGVIYIDDSGRITSVNPAGERIAGLPAHEIIGKSVVDASWRVIREDGSVLSRDELPIPKALESGTPTRAIVGVFNPAENMYRWVETHAIPLFNEGEDKPCGAFATFDDITERKKLELEQARSVTVLEATPDFVGMADLSERVVYLNRAGRQMMGLDEQEDVTRTTIADFCPPAGVVLDEGVPKAISDGTWSGEAVLRNRDGREIPVSLVILAHKTPTGEVQFISMIARDMSERQREETILREQKELLQTIFDRIPVMISLCDSEDQFLLANREWESVMGWTFEEAESRPSILTKLLPGAEEFRRALHFAREATGEWRDFRITVRSGRTVDVSYASIRLSDGKRIGIGQDITERKQNEENLKLAKEEAERANRAKSEFLSRMSHELRTPLNAIIGFGQLFNVADLSEGDRENVQQIQKAGRHLLALVNEVLDITRIETGRLTLSLEPVSVREVVDEVLGLMQPLASHAGVRLENRLTDEPHVLADRQRFKQVLLNIVSNAVKFNIDDGSVTVSLETNGQAARILVADTGLGIAPHDLQKLFVPFERLKAAERGIEGTGVGLALSKRLIELMGGSISVKSRVGEGSTFSIELPQVEAPSISSGCAESETTRVKTQASPEYAVLYIEDNLSNLKLIERIFLHRSGLRLMTAMQGGLGLELAREHHPQLILLDLHLPDMPGDEVLRRLQADVQTRGIPVVVISADATPGQVTRLLESGARHYLTKPLDVRATLQVLDDILGAQQLINPANTVNEPRDAAQDGNQMECVSRYAGS